MCLLCFSFFTLGKTIKPMCPMCLLCFSFFTLGKTIKNYVPIVFLFSLFTYFVIFEN